MIGRSTLSTVKNKVGCIVIDATSDLFPFAPDKLPVKFIALTAQRKTVLLLGDHSAGIQPRNVRP